MVLGRCMGSFRLGAASKQHSYELVGVVGPEGEECLGTRSEQATVRLLFNY